MRHHGGVTVDDAPPRTRGKRPPQGDPVVDRALANAARAVPDWAGGTRMNPLNYV